MNDELMPYATGEVVPRRGDRQVARKAKAIYDEVRLAAMKERGAFALGADIMDQTVQLYHKGAQLAGDDPVLGRILADELHTTVRKAQSIQKNLFGDEEQGWFG